MEPLNIASKDPYYQPFNSEVNAEKNKQSALNLIFLKLKDQLGLTTKSNERVVAKVTELLSSENHDWLESKDIDEILDLALRAGIIEKGQPIDVALGEMIEEFSQLTEALHIEIFLAFIEKDLQKLLEFAKTVPNELKLVMAMQDEEGKTPLHWAASNGSIESYELMYQLSPKKFKESLLVLDDDGLTPIHEAFWNNEVSIAAFMAEKAPQEFRKAMHIKNQQNETLLHWGIAEDVEFLKLIDSFIPLEFNEMLGMKDLENTTPLHVATFKSNVEALRYINSKYPHVIREMLCQQDITLSTLVHCAVSGKSPEVLKILFEIAPDQFMQALAMLDSSDRTPFQIAFLLRDLETIKFLAPFQIEQFKQVILDHENLPLIHVAVNRKDFKFLKLMAEIAPEEFKKSLFFQEKKNGNTPVHLAILGNKDELVNFFASQAPEEFKNVLLIKNTFDETPLLIAISMNEFNLETLKFMIALSPEASEIKLGETLLSRLRRVRGKNYSKIARLLKENDPWSDAIAKEVFKRKAVAHAFHIPGTTTLLTSGASRNLVSFNLQGHTSDQWFHLMRKDLDTFVETYPKLLNTTQLRLVKDVMAFAANSNILTSEEKLERIKQGLPTVINAGFKDHCVTLLIWSNQIWGSKFVICNRGDGSRVPVDIFDFDVDNFELNDLLEIENVFFQGNLIDYQKMFFETLHQKLNFFKSVLDRKLQNALFLPRQAEGNCSFISPITSIYSLFLLESFLSEPVNNEMINSAIFDERVSEPVLLYETWLSFQQMTILERLVKRVEDFNSLIAPDHGLILNALSNAYRLPLDKLSLTKLENLSAIYLNSLEEKDKEKVKTQLIFWRYLPKEEFLYR